MKIVIVTGNRSEFGILEKFNSLCSKLGHKTELLGVEAELDDAYLQTKTFLDFYQDIDVMFLFGDRREMLGAAIAGYENKNVLLVHHHAGDWTNTNHPDEPTRDSISLFSHVLFPACESSYSRCGSINFNLRFNHGSIALDGLSKVQSYGLKEKEVFVLYNPIKEEDGIPLIINALKDIGGGLHVTFIEPNGDEGSERLIEWYQSQSKFNGIRGARYVSSLERPNFLSLLKDKNAYFIGNSSAFFIEGSYPSWNLKERFTHIGKRNKDRNTNDSYGNGSAGKLIIGKIDRLLDKKEEIIKNHRTFI